MLATSSTQEHALDTETNSRSFSLGIKSRLLALEYLSPADQFPIRGREKSLDNRSYLGIGAHQHSGLAELSRAPPGVPATLTTTALIASAVARDQHLIAEQLLVAVWTGNARSR